MLPIYNEKLLQLEQRIKNLEDEFKSFQEKTKKKKRAENDNKVSLEILKQEFLELNPKGTVLLSPQELVLYAAMLYNENNSSVKDRITSWSELAKRTKKMKSMLEYFKQIKDDGEWIKQKSKDWVEYIFSVVKTYKDFKDGQTKPLSFYQGISTWALQEFSVGFKSYCQNKRFQDVTLEEE